MATYHGPKRAERFLIRKTLLSRTSFIVNGLSLNLELTYLWRNQAWSFHKELYKSRQWQGNWVGNGLSTEKSRQQWGARSIVPLWLFWNKAIFSKAKVNKDLWNYLMVVESTVVRKGHRPSLLLGGNHLYTDREIHCPWRLLLWKDWIQDSLGLYYSSAVCIPSSFRIEHYWAAY